MQAVRFTNRLLSKVQQNGTASWFSGQTNPVFQAPVISVKFSTTSVRKTTNSEKGKKLSYEGILVPVYTPFTETSDRPALDVIPKYSRYLASKGIKGVLVNGTNAEGMTMTVSERTSIAEAWIQAGHADKLHVQVQVGGTNIKDVLTLAKHAESHGADSLLTLPELYYKPQNVPALVDYLRFVAGSAPSTPVLYYHIPVNSNVNLNLIELMNRAGKEIPTFSGIKFTDGDMIVGESCANLDPQNYKVFLGGNEIMSGAYLLGFRSCTAASANMFPKLCLEILEAVKNGNIDEAKEKQKQLNIGIKTVSQFGNRIACFKAATEIISGVKTGPTRYPLPQLDQQAKEKIRKSLESIGVI